MNTSLTTGWKELRGRQRNERFRWADEWWANKTRIKCLSAAELLALCAQREDGTCLPAGCFVTFDGSFYAWGLGGVKKIKTLWWRRWNRRQMKTKQDWETMADESLWSCIVISPGDLAANRRQHEEGWERESEWASEWVSERERERHVLVYEWASEWVSERMSLGEVFDTEQRDSDCDLAHLETWHLQEPITGGRERGV